MAMAILLGMVIFLAVVGILLALAAGRRRRGIH